MIKRIPIFFTVSKGKIEVLFFILVQAQTVPVFIGLHDQYNIGVFIWDQPENKTLTVIFLNLSIKTIKILAS